MIYSFTMLWSRVAEWYSQNLMPHFAEEPLKKATLALREDFLQKVLPTANRTEKQSLTLDLIQIYIGSFGCPGRKFIIYLSFVIVPEEYEEFYSWI